MDFAKTFAVVHNWKPVKHEGGATFNLLPSSHHEMWQTLMRNVKLAKLDTYQRFWQDMSEDKPVKYSDYFETAAEMEDMENHMVASHIQGWADLTMNGEPLVFSYEQAFNLVSQYPPFKEWVKANLTALSKAEEEANEVIEAVKKKSRTTSRGKSSGVNSQATPQSQPDDQTSPNTATPT